MITDPIADLLTRIRNAQRAGHVSVCVGVSKKIENVLVVLKREGFIEGFEKKENSKSKREMLQVFLRYFKPGEPLMSELRRVSKPGRRVYMGYKELPKIARGLGISVVSTSRGVMSDREARKQKLGGEVLACIS